MATMIPDTPRDFVPSSLEGTMFDGLAKLPSDYYVFHSFRIITVEENVIKESETDFVVFHPAKGILVIEAKAGHVRYSDGRWLYGSGDEMAYGGPFNQGRRYVRRILQLFEKERMGALSRKCKVLSSVWFPSVSNDEFSTVNLPSEASREAVMLKEDVFDPAERIERIFELGVPGGITTELSPIEAKSILSRILAPSFDLFTSSTLDIDLGRHAFKRMIAEQVKVFDFIEDQASVSINGAAGTGKTVLAIEKAQREALRGERVLFLCFNRNLRDHLYANHADELIDFFTIDGYALEVLGRVPDSLKDLSDKLEALYSKDKFPYKHVIVDEGQDFGQERIDEADVLSTFLDITQAINGSFYIFYDKMQCIQSDRLPKCINDTDCKVTLKRNCRNTENIAITSLKTLGLEKPPQMMDGLLKGDFANLRIVEKIEDAVAGIDDALKECLSEGFQDIVILSCTSLSRSCLVERIRDGYYEIGERSIPVETCRRFKGLEADAVVLIDVDADNFAEMDNPLLYVGASRARLKLEIVARMSEDECLNASERLGRHSRRRPKKTLATAINALLK